MLCSLHTFFITIATWTIRPNIEDQWRQSLRSKSHFFLLSSLPIDIKNRSKGMLLSICLFFCLGIGVWISKGNFTCSQEKYSVTRNWWPQWRKNCSCSYVFSPWILVFLWYFSCQCLLLEPFLLSGESGSHF